MEAQSAEKGYEKKNMKYFMDTLEPTSGGVQQMKDNIKVTVEQAKTVCGTTNNWIHFVRKREQPVDAL